MTSWTFEFIIDHLLLQWLVGEEIDKKIQMFEYLTNEKSFLDKVKSIFMILKDFLLAEYEKMADNV